MAWVSVSNFFSRYRNLKPPAEFLKSEISLIIKDVLGVLLEPEEISIKGGVISIKTKNPLIKNSIFLKKEKILESLKQKIGQRAPRDLRFEI